MRFALRFLPAFLSLLVPLAVLAWLGSLEFGRLEERAERALRDQAFQFLHEAAQAVAAAIADAQLALAPPFDLRREQRVATAAALREEHLAIRDLFLLDGDGHLEFPRLPAEDAELPFAGAAGPLATAEWLFGLGDLAAARAELEAAIERLDRRRTPDRRAPPDRHIRMRARFLLAGVLHELGEPAAAAERYREASADGQRILETDARGRWRADAASCRLLSEMALAEIAARDDGGHGAALALAAAIAAGQHDEVGDPLCSAVLRRLRDTCAAADGDALAAAFALDEQRQAGRRFALEFRDLAAETVRRRLRRPDAEEPVLQAYAAIDSCSLLVLRRPTAREEPQVDDIDEPWVGVRLDLSFLVHGALDRQLAGAEGFTLAIFGPDGEPIAGALDTPEPTLSATALAAQTVVGGLRLLAIPAQPAAVLAEREAAFRNRALLVITLCVLAGVGAFFLLRSVGREAELAALKVDLVSRVSHELRTPLSLIKMYSETLGLGRARDAEQARRFAGIISREADRLTGLIQRILDFSSQEAGRFTYQREDVDASALLRTVTDDYRPHVETAHGRITADLEPGLRLHTDPGALASAYLNLLENAVKYTPADAPDRSIEVELRSSDGHAVLEVRDRGVGVPATEREHIFESFYRATTAGEVRGAGLGLSLVRHFAEAHDGTIAALPRDGGGSVFRLRLPLHRRDAR